MAREKIGYITETLRGFMVEYDFKNDHLGNRVAQKTVPIQRGTVYNRQGNPVNVEEFVGHRVRFRFSGSVNHADYVTVMNKLIDNTSKINTSKIFDNTI